MRSKHLWLLLLFTGFQIGLVQAQTSQVASWEVSSEKVTEKGATHILSFRITLAPGWYTYSVDQDPGLGPVPASVVFEKSNAFTLVGAPKSRKVKEKYDDVWEGTIRIIEESGGGFTQTIQVLKPNPVIRGKIVYTVCSEKTGQCLFPEEAFELTLPTKNH